MSDSLDFPYMAVLPYNVLINKNIEPNAKIHYACLAGLAKKEGYCWATDEQLAEMHGVSVRQIRNWLASLESQGFIRRDTINTPYRNDDGVLLWKRKRRIFIGNGFISNMSETEENFPQEKSEISDAEKNCRIVDAEKNCRIVDAEKNCRYKEEISKDKISNTKTYSSDSPCSSEQRAMDDLIFCKEEKKFKGISEEDLSSWKVAYPEVNLEKEIAAATEWIKSNPNKSHKKLWRKFLTSWFERVNERNENKSAYRKTYNSQANHNKVDRRTRNIDGTPVDAPYDGEW